MSSTTDNEQRFAYLLSPEFQIVNTAGKPLTGGWIEVYIHGTRVKYYCFSDFDGTLHPFQIPLDSLGSNIVLASPTHAYDIYIYNKFGSLVMSRYNVVPACNAADIVEDVVVIDSPDETINVTCDGGSNWHLEVNTDLIATASGLAEVSGALTEVSGTLLNKKDKQEPIDVSGSVTKTVTNIKQNENGEIEITYEDIDLPQQVPNVDIISPSGTLDITSTTDPATNTKTFKIDVHKSNMDYFEGYYGRARYEDRPSDTVAAFTTYVDQWREYRYQGDFIANSWQDQDNTTFLLNSGLYLITASIRYKMTDASIKNKEEYIRIATGAFNGLENGTQLKDWSNEAALDENTIQLSFVRSVDDDEDYDNLRGNHTLYFAPYLPYGVEYAEIDHLQIVKLDSIVSYHGGSGPRYSPGYGIEIQDDVISVATGDVITNNYFETVVSSINNEINELTTVVNNVSGDITNLSESVTNLIGATGDYATKDYVDAAVSGLENYSAGQYVSIEDHVINVTGVQPEGDYATNADLQTVSAAIPDTQEVEFQELDVDSLATIEYVDNRIATAAGDVYEAGQYISIEDGVIAATGLQPAGDYATEQYVDEAIAAVTGQPIGQVQSDWTQTDDTEVDYIKHKPRQVNLVAGDNITIEQDGLDVIISAEDPGDTYNAGQYISIQNNTIAATGLQPAGNYLTPADLNGYATEQYVDDAVAAVTGQPITQVNSDWLATSGVAEILNKPDVFQLIAGDNIDITPSGNDLVISASSDVTKVYVDEQIDAVTGMIPTLPAEEEVEFEELNLSDYALASAIPDISDLATKTELANAIDAATGMIPDVSNFATNDDVQYVQEQVDQLVAATGYYLQASDLAGYATEQELQAVADSIPDISNLATKTEVDAVSAAIPTLPQEEEVEFEELNLTDYALASAIPDISNLATKSELEAVESEIPVVTGFATKAELQEVEAEIPDVSNLATKAEVQAVTGMIPDISDLATKSELEAVEAEIPDVSNLATKTELATVDAKVDAVSAAIPAEEEVEFEELDLSIYALASAVPDTTQLETDVANLVAATGDYLTEQVQSDWTEIDDEDPAYILNKPVETDLIAGANIAITDVGSGIMISASGGGAAYVAGDGIDITNDTISLDNPVNLVAGDNVNITVSGDDVVISASGGSNYTAGDGISIEDNTISVDETVITTEASGVYLPNSNFEIAPDGRAAIVEGGTTTDYTPTWMSTAGSNVLSFATPITLIAGDTISFSHAGYPWVDIRINGTSVASEYTTGSQYTYTVESDILVSEIVIDLWNESDPPDPLRLNTVTIASNAVQRDEYVLMSELASAIETLPTPVQSDWNVTDTDNLAYIKNKPGNNRFVPNPPADYSYAGWILTNVGNGTTSWRPPAGSYSAGKGISLANNIISVNDTVITTAATAVNLPNANFEIDNDGQAYKVSTSSDTTTYTITPTSTGGTFDGTIKLKAGDTITITNCPVTNEYLYVTLRRSSETSFAQFYGSATAGSDINLTVLQDTDLTGTFNIAVREDMDFQSYSLTNSSCLIASVITSREEYALDSDLETKQNTLTGITDVQVVQALPVSPVSSVLYLIPEA